MDNRESSRDYWLKTLNDYKVPSHLAGTLARYIMQGGHVGSFLTAVLTNDLLRAFRYSDAVSWKGLGNLLQFLVSEVPSKAWGSTKKVESWEGIRNW